MNRCLSAGDFADLIEPEESGPTESLRNHLSVCAGCDERYRRLLAAQQALQASGLLLQSQSMPSPAEIARAQARLLPQLAAGEAATTSLWNNDQIRLLRELVRPACGEPASSLLIGEAANRASRNVSGANWNDFLRLFADLFCELCGEAAGRMVLLCAEQI